LENNSCLLIPRHLIILRSIDLIDLLEGRQIFLKDKRPDEKRGKREDQVRKIEDQI